MLVQGSHHRVRYLFPMCQQNTGGTRGLSQRWLLHLAHSGEFPSRRDAIVASQGQPLSVNSATAQTNLAPCFHTAQQLLHQGPTALRISLNFMEIASGSAVGG